MIIIVLDYNYLNLVFDHQQKYLEFQDFLNTKAQFC